MALLPVDEALARCSRAFDAARGRDRGARRGRGRVLGRGRRGAADPAALRCFGHGRLCGPRRRRGGRAARAEGDRHVAAGARLRGPRRARRGGAHLHRRAGAGRRRRHPHPGERRERRRRRVAVERRRARPPHPPARARFRRGRRSLLAAGRALGPRAADARRGHEPCRSAGPPASRASRSSPPATSSCRPARTRGPTRSSPPTASALPRWSRPIGGEPIDLGIAPDEPREHRRRSARAGRAADILVTIGGASVGEHDLVQAALNRSGMALDFWKIAMRPGKPLMFGRLGEQRVLGLPGNPVSALVCAHAVPGAAHARACSACRAGAAEPEAVLGAAMRPTAARRITCGPRSRVARGRQRVVTPLPSQDSSMLAALVARRLPDRRAPHRAGPAEGAASGSCPRSRLGVGNPNRARSVLAPPHLVEFTACRTQTEQVECS